VGYHDTQRLSQRLNDVVGVDPIAAAVEQDMMVGAEAEDVVEGVWTIVRPAERTDVRGLGALASRYLEGLPSELKRVPMQGIDLSHSHLGSPSQLRGLDV
jgi:hypothetical protein